MSEFPLTYMYFIEDSVKELPSPPPFYMTHKPYYTAIHSPSHDITVSQLWHRRHRRCHCSHAMVVVEDQHGGHAAAACFLFRIRSSPRFTRFDGRSHVPVFSFSLWTLTYAQDCECVEACSDDDVSVCGKRFRK